MIKVGLTGGIGSGKTVVCRIFESMDIPVFYADKEAKNILWRSTEVKMKIKALMGKSAYHPNGRPNRSFIASRIFNDTHLLKKINAVIHPAVGQKFEEWAKTQSSPYVIEEAAILFETGISKKFDFTILVTAPKEIRLYRIMKRDKLNEQQVSQRMANQWPESRKIPLADFIINNDGSSGLIRQIAVIHKILLRHSKEIN